VLMHRPHVLRAATAIIDLVAKHNLPTIYGWGVYAVL